MVQTTAGRIVEVSTDSGNRIGLIEFGGRRRPIYLDLVPDAHAGDWVRFHAGFATEKVQTGEAGSTAARPCAALDPENKHAWRLLKELDREQLKKLIPLAGDREFEPGEVIFRSGERSAYLHLIVSGDVALTEDSGWRPFHVSTLTAGDALGWSAFTGEGKAMFEARAVSRVCTVAFAGSELRQACDADPVLGYALAKKLLDLSVERLDALRRGANLAAVAA